MQSKLKPCFPVVNEVKDLSNGCAIAAVIHYYCPSLLRLEGTLASQIFICQFIDDDDDDEEIHFSFLVYMFFFQMHV